MQVASHFASTINVRRTGAYDKDGRALWQVTKPLLYFSEKMDSWLLACVEEFITNYASVPRIPIIFELYGDKVYEEPAFHDQLYTLHAVILITFAADGSIATQTIQPISRADADALFLEALYANPSVSSEEAEVMYAGVRAGGHSSWEDDTNVTQPAHIMALIQPA